MSPQTRAAKLKIKQIEVHQTKKLLQSERNHQQNEKATHKWKKMLNITSHQGNANKNHLIPAGI